MSRCQDCLYINTVTSFDFLDRIRILISGKVILNSKTTTETVIGEHVTNVAVWPAPPKFLTRNHS